MPTVTPTARKTLGQSALILLLAALGTFWTFQCHPKRPTLYLQQSAPPEKGIELATILAWEPPPRWIDTRPADEFALGHIPEAISLPPEDLQTALSDHVDLFIDRRQRFVLYGPESACQTVAERLRGLGLTQIETLRGGWSAWKDHQP